MSNTDGERVQDGGDTTQSPTTDMTAQDWVDISESEFVDVVSGELTDKTGFVFDHPEIGLHGFEFHPDRFHIRAVSYEKQESKQDE